LRGSGALAVAVSGAEGALALGATLDVPLLAGAALEDGGALGTALALAAAEDSGAGPALFGSCLQLRANDKPSALSHQSRRRT
jgi:hypothetical protein